MTKRILALVLVCILAIPILVVPASATTYTGEYDYNIWSDLHQVRYFVTSIYGWLTGQDSEHATDNFQTFMQGLHDEIGEWLGTMGADIKDGLLVIGNACVDIYEFLVTALFELLDIIAETIIDFSLLVNDWFGVCADWLELTYNNVKTNFETLFATYLYAIKNDVSYCKTYLKQLLGTDTTEADEFKDQISTEATEFDEAVDSMTEATLPDYESIDTDFGDYLGTNAYVNISQFYGAFFSGGTLYYVLMLAVTFALLSYSLFGKR